MATWLKRLRLSDWRNFRDEVIAFETKINALCGKNGAGKTNCLEAIAFLSRGVSFRNASLTELRASNSQRFLLEVIFESEGVEHRLTLKNQDKFVIAHFNGQRIRQWRGLFPVVLWLPQDAELVRGSPTLRRRFLDDHLHQSDPLFSHHWIRYHRFLKQRNHLLKQKRGNELAPWDQAISKAGGYLCWARYQLIERLELLLREFFAELQKKERIDLIYRPALGQSSHKDEPKALPTEREIEDQLLKVLAAKRGEELRWGTTLYGPHRDDFELYWENHRARHYISNGQAKLCSAGFKVAEWRQMAKTNQKPILLIDEFGSGLDHDHQRGIWEAFAPAEQIIAACSTLQHQSLQNLTKTPFHSICVEKGQFYPSKD